MRLKIINALTSACLLLLLTSCASERIVYVKPPPIPANLLMPCVTPTVKQNFTFGDSVIYIEQLFNVIEKCNEQKKAIREINQFS